MPLPDRRFVSLSGAALLLAGCAQNPPAPRQPSFYRNLAEPGAVLDQAMAAAMISGYRENNRLGPVSVDPRLSSVAHDLASEMARADDVRVSLRQPPLRERLGRRGFQATAAEENVSAGYRTLAEAFSGWRGSPPHDRVMKLAGATRLGIAAVRAPASRYGCYWALVMANGA